MRAVNGRDAYPPLVPQVPVVVGLVLDPLPHDVANLDSPGGNIAIPLFFHCVANLALARGRIVSLGRVSFFLDSSTR